MIFADDVGDIMPRYRTMLDSATKLLVTPAVYDMALELVAGQGDKIAKISKFTIWPEYDTWLECTTKEGRFAFMFYGKETESVTNGWGVFVIQPSSFPKDQIEVVPVSYDLPNYRLSWYDAAADLEQSGASLRMLAKMPFDVQQLYRKMLNDKPDAMAENAKYGSLLAQWKPILFTLLALLNSPKIISRSKIDVTKINKQRVRKGNYPFHPHHQIKINVDSIRVSIGPSTGEGREREQFKVRSHLRFYVHPRYQKSGVTVIIVKPHFRGNPELGMRNTSYEMVRGNSK